MELKIVSTSVGCCKDYWIGMSKMRGTAPYTQKTLYKFLLLSFLLMFIYPCATFSSSKGPLLEGCSSGISEADSKRAGHVSRLQVRLLPWVKELRPHSSDRLVQKMEAPNFLFQRGQ